MQKTVYKILCFSFSCLFMISCASIRFSPEKIAYHPPSPKFSNIEVALVLGGGGARGVAHVGVLEELLKAGIRPDLIVGCSAGAMVGALYADSLDINYVKSVVLSTKLDHMLDVSHSFLRFSISDGNKLDSYMRQKIKARNFEDLKMPFIAVATNLQFGDVTAFGSGPLIPALRASAAFPGAFFPIEVSKQYFIDGAVSDPVPVQTARNFNPKIVIAVDISEELTEQQPNHMLGLLKRSLEISYFHLSTLTAQKGDIVIEFPFRDIGTFNEEMAEYLYEEGRKVTVSKLTALRALIKKKIPRYRFAL